MTTTEKQGKISVIFLVSVTHLEQEEFRLLQIASGEKEERETDQRESSSELLSMAVNLQYLAC